MPTVTSRHFNRYVSAAKRAAAAEAVVITDRGKPSHVLLSIEQYHRLVADQRSIVDGLCADDDVELVPVLLARSLTPTASTDQTVIPSVLPRRYAACMGVRRLSISVPPEVEQSIRVAAAGAGLPVSNWLAEVAAQAALVQAPGRARAAATAREPVVQADGEHAHRQQRGTAPPAARRTARRRARAVGLAPTTRAPRSPATASGPTSSRGHHPVPRATARSWSR